MFSKYPVVPAGLAVAGIAAFLIASCGTQKKLESILYDDAPVPAIHEAKLPDVPIGRRSMMRDTVKFRDDKTGEEWFLMKTHTDEVTGEVTASEVLEEAVVTARFRNVAERNGRVELRFQILVPPSVQDSKWQVQLYPDMFALEDSIRLDPVVITGKKYREEQMKGYERYAKLLSEIETAPDTYLNRRNLEIFLARNLPEVYALKNDTTYVSDERFATIYGLHAQEIVDHYSHAARIRKNQQKKAQLRRMNEQYKQFLDNEGIRLDTVLVDDKGTFVYEYVESVRTRPGLRKVDVVLSGEVLEKGNVIYSMPAGDPYTFYISTTSSLSDPKEKYVSRIIERRVASNMSLHIDFRQGSSEVVDSLGNNANELSRVRRVLDQLVHDTEFDLDSIVVTASSSPEGAWALNERLSRERSLSVSAYFEEYLSAIRNRYEEEDSGLHFDESGNLVETVRRRIPFKNHYIVEDWQTLDMLVMADTAMTEKMKREYATFRDYKDADGREYRMHKMSWYPHLKESVYPKLRRVDFDFFLHRKGMVRDTMVTTVIDSVYMHGLAALQDMDYPKAANLLASYKDYNTAVAFIGDERNLSALEILSGLPQTASVHYLLAIVNARLGNQQEAVQHYMMSCKMDRSFVFRGNLDPEISELIAVYGINKEDN